MDFSTEVALAATQSFNLDTTLSRPSRVLMCMGNHTINIVDLPVQLTLSFKVPLELFKELIHSSLLHQR
jgi:hypothetical protein